MNNSRQYRSPRPVIATSVPKLKRMIRIYLYAHSREAGSSTTVETIRACSKREDTLGAIADHLVCAEHPPEEEKPMRAEKTIAMSQETLTDAIAGICRLPEDSLTALNTTKCHNGVKKTDYRLHAMLLDGFSKTLDEKLNSV